MTDKTIKMIINEARRAILIRLNIIDPDPTTCRKLYDTLQITNAAYDKTYFRKDIYYFHKKGWLEFVDDKIGGSDNFDTKVIAFTDKGKEVAEDYDIESTLEY